VQIASIREAPLLCSEQRDPETRLKYIQDRGGGNFKNLGATTNRLSISFFSLFYISAKSRGHDPHWANFNKKVHKPPYWTLEVARVKKARLGANMHLVSFHIFCKLEYFGL
jgi:hypothetical protein